MYFILECNVSDINNLKEEDMKELIQLQAKDIPEIRNSILDKQKGLCAICTNQITEKSGVSLDHQHRFKSEEIGVDGGGLIRGVLCRSCNVFEGKIWNNSSRYEAGKTVQERIEWLESLVSYYKQDTYQYIHPSEKQKEPKLKKQSYNILKKIYDGKAKFPLYPSSGKLTKKLKDLFEKYHIIPEYYK